LQVEQRDAVADFIHPVNVTAYVLSLFGEVCAERCYEVFASYCHFVGYPVGGYVKMVEAVRIGGFYTQAPHALLFQIV